MSRSFLFGEAFLLFLRDLLLALLTLLLLHLVLSLDLAQAIVALLSANSLLLFGLLLVLLGLALFGLFCLGLLGIRVAAGFVRAAFFFLFLDGVFILQASHNLMVVADIRPSEQLLLYFFHRNIAQSPGNGDPLEDAFLDIRPTCCIF